MISKASNFERFIFDLLGRDSSALNDHWKKIDEGKSFKLKEENFQKIKDYGFVSSSSKHINRVNFIRSIYNDFGVIIDTLSNPMPSNSFIFFNFIAKTQDFHSVIIKRVWFRKVQHVEFHFLTLGGV